MLKRLALCGVGPAHKLGPFELASRVNVVTGDNGLGKTLLLDVAWWTLTGTWPGGRPVLPRDDASQTTPPAIEATIQGKAQEAQVTGSYDFLTQSWASPTGRPPMPGLVLYFQVDGRFSLWDPAQHSWRQGKDADAIHFAPGEAWNAVQLNGKPICRGLIEDWVTWQQTRSREYEQLLTVLSELSPSDEEPLVPGEPTRVWLDDVRLYPTLELPYGRTPVTVASAGVQRVLLIAYLLVWAWHQHQSASKLQRQEPESRLVVLFDEPETHMHPQWQRRLLPSLLRVTQALRADMQVQLLVSTHAPLVLASLEPEFSPEEDQLFHLRLQEPTRQAVIEPLGFTPRGDVLNWLVSETFGLRQARSLPAEQAIEAAERLMRGVPEQNPEGLRTKDEIDRELSRLLGDRDPFWPRWFVRTRTR